MIIPDVNILINAHRKDAVQHARYKAWLEKAANGPANFGMCDLALSGFLRIVTNPRIYGDPTPMAQALAVVEDIRSHPNCVVVSPGPRHWDIFIDLCAASGVRGNLVPDAYLAALAIESGSEWITDDGDFGRFPGLRWRRPF